MGALDNEAKKQVISKIAGNLPIQVLPKDKVRVGRTIIHVRCTTRGKGGGRTWSFNINPNTLTAHYELWICGKPDKYYLIPIEVMKAIYDDPASWPDKMHPEIRVADIDTRTHECFYGGVAKGFSSYFCAPLFEGAADS